MLPACRAACGLVHDVQAYALQSGVQRVVGYLLRDIADGRDDGRPVTVSLPVSKATVASRLSLTPEYFSRVLHELESTGLIEIDRRDIHILDAEGLVPPFGRIDCWPLGRRVRRPIPEGMAMCSARKTIKPRRKTARGHGPRAKSVIVIDHRAPV